LEDSGKWRKEKQLSKMRIASDKVITTKPFALSEGKGIVKDLIN
jgi:hypothetical protein